MAQAEIIKIGILGLKNEQEKIIDVLYDFSQLQITDVSEEGAMNDDISELDYKLAQIKFFLDFIGRYAPEQKVSLREKIIKAGSQGIDISKQEVNKLVEEIDYKKIVSQTEDIEEKINLKQSTIASLRSEIDELTPFNKLSFNYQISKSERLISKVGVFEKSRFEILLQKIAKDLLPVEITKVDENEREVRVSIIYLSDIAEELQILLTEAEYKEVSLPELDDTPKKVILDKQKNIAELNHEVENLAKEATKLFAYQEKMQIISDCLSWERDKLAASKMSSQGGQTFYLHGFIASDRLKNLEKRLGKKTANFEIVQLPIEEGEDIPVILRNNKVISPFEAVTNIYGAPKSDEFDPTPYLAPFFILFFGICLSDAGYGLLLGGFSFLAIKILKIPKDKQGFLRLLVYAGISTFIIGALFGGWFGLVLEDLPQNAVTNFLLSLRVIDPVKNPLIMLIFSLILGLLQVITGIIVNLYYQVTRKDWNKVFDAGVWLLFIFGIVFWIVSGNVLHDPILQIVGKYWIYVAIGILVLTQGRGQKNIFLKLPLGALSLYDVVGYFSDIMSYSRLLALGLSTGIIAMVINMVAMLFKDMIPFIGWPVAILILIGGHLFNLAINALGSFIHSGRLQYVEFFPKFMEGGGTRFKPFVKTSKYIDIYKLNKDDNDSS